MAKKQHFLKEYRKPLFTYTDMVDGQKVTVKRFAMGYPDGVSEELEKEYRGYTEAAKKRSEKS